MSRIMKKQVTWNGLETLPEEYLELLFEKDRQGQWGQWVHGLIHNINGPLQNISMLLEMLIQGHARLAQTHRIGEQQNAEDQQTLTDKQSRRLNQLNQQVGILAEMLRDFMLLHQIEQSESEVDLRLVVNKLACVFRADPFFKHQVKLELQLTENLPFVRIFGRHLVPSLVHLIDNALISMRQAPQKQLTIRGYVEDKWICLLFKDSGCGLDPDCKGEDLFRLFRSHWPEPLQKSKRDEGHFGFGLYAVQHLLGPYGVKTSLKRDGEGTAVILRIPPPS